MPTQPRYWHFHHGRLGEVLLGPHLRAVEMSRAAAAAGMDAVLVLDDPSGRPVEGVRQEARATFDYRHIRPGDRVVVSDSAPARVPWTLARLGVPYHADCYGMAIPELAFMYESMPVKFVRRDGFRRNLRFQFHAHFAERIYLSHEPQLFVLAGMVFAGNTLGAHSATSSLDRKVAFLPMGVPDLPAQVPEENPYPSAIGDRPVFLWGGGIWSWFDVDTLLDAFAILHRRGSDAVLFFLAGKDHSGIEVHARATAEAIDRAEKLGLRDRNVFFNARDAGPSDLPSYLRHAAAGVMANRACLESITSWRTRYLDLMAARLPLAASGPDPLGLRLQAAGAAFVTAAGDAAALAANLEKLASDPALRRSMGNRAKEVGERMSWTQTLDDFRTLLESPSSFDPALARRPGNTWLLRYATTWFRPRWGI